MSARGETLRPIPHGKAHSMLSRGARRRILRDLKRAAARARRRAERELVQGIIDDVPRRMTKGWLL